MKQATRVATTTPVTVSATTDFAVVSNLAAAGPVAVTLPAGADGQVFVIGDNKADANTNNITITPNGAETINGSATLVLNHARQMVLIQYNLATTNWVVLMNNIKPGTLVTGDISGQIAIAQGGTGQATANTALNALLPNQATHSGKALVTDATNTAWTAIITNPMDSAGDMIYGGAAGVPTKLDSGTSQNWLISGGAGAPTWGNTVTTGKTVDGSSDEVQLTVQGHSTQTNTILLVEKSDSTDLLQVTNINGTNIRGTTTNDNAATGFVGEYVVGSLARSSRDGLVTGTAEDEASISLTAGHWKIGAVAGFLPTAGTTITQLNVATSTTTGTMPSVNQIAISDSSGNMRTTFSQASANNVGLDVSLQVPDHDVKLTATTSFYLVVSATFSGTLQAWGQIYAWRVR